MNCFEDYQSFRLSPSENLTCLVRGARHGLLDEDVLSSVNCAHCPFEMEPIGELTLWLAQTRVNGRMCILQGCRQHQCRGHRGALKGAVRLIARTTSTPHTPWKQFRPAYTLEIPCAFAYSSPLILSRQATAATTTSSWLFAGVKIAFGPMRAAPSTPNRNGFSVFGDVGGSLV